VSGVHVFARSWKIRIPGSWRLRIARMFFRLTVHFGSPREGDVTFLSDGLNSIYIMGWPQPEPIGAKP
jgi:hypothetical protein